jgi:DNA-binding transcriptional ArsR family regulator
LAAGADVHELVLDKPEQLKALGHPLRLRVLEMLGESHESNFTNRELAQKLGVDPGHLHFHVRMLLKTGLIELVDNGRGHGREKPYRAVARTFRVAPELLASSGARDIQAAMIDEVQRAHAVFAGTPAFRGAQTRIKLPLEETFERMREELEQARDDEQDDLDKVVVTVFVHPPRGRE